MTEQVNQVGQNREKCWCGGNFKQSTHSLYNQCVKCETLSLKNIFHEEHLRKFYGFQEYWHEHQTEISRHPAIEERAKNDFRDRVPVWFNALTKYKDASKIDNLLEIGCAPGSFLKYCKDNGVKNVSGIEVDKLTCRFIEQHFDFTPNSIIDGFFPNIKIPNNKKFDAICAFDLVEHLQNPIESMKKVKSLLKKNGIFFFQTPYYRGECEDWIQFRVHEHVYLYNDKSFKLLLDKAGLKIINLSQGYFPDDMFIVGGLK